MELRRAHGLVALSATEEWGGLGDDGGGHDHGLRAVRSWASWRRRSARRALHGDTDPAGGGSGRRRRQSEGERG